MSRTQVSIKGAISCIRRHKTISREIRKFKQNLLNSELMAIVQAWWLHSRTQTMGSRFLRAGEKSVNRVTGAAANVTDAAVNAINYVNPVNVLGSWSSPFSPITTASSKVERTDMDGHEVEMLKDGDDSHTAPLSTQRLARNLPHTARSRPNVEELVQKTQSEDPAGVLSFEESGQPDVTAQILTEFLRP